MKAALTGFGLTPTEADIYLQLINKQQTAVQLAKATKIHRRTIYDNLNILLNRGLVSYEQQNNVKHYTAANPEILLALEHERLEKLKQAIPALKKRYEEQQQEPEAQTLRGADAARHLLLEMRKTTSEVLWMGGGFKILDVVGNAQLLREVKNHELRIIQPRPKTDEYKKHFTNVRFIDTPLESSGAFFVFENYLIIGTISNNEFFITKIHSKEITSTYKTYFDILWKNLEG